MLELIQQEQLPEDFADNILPHYRQLAEWINQQQTKRQVSPLLVAVNGAQGTGKSTLALFLKALLEKNHHKRVAVLSIDDLYLTHHEREELAIEIHPLLKTRGVPGTHDLRLGQNLLKQLAQAGEQDSVKIPAFDKARDDRKPETDWPEVQGPIDIIILEGWCVGAKAVPYDALDYDANKLEAEHDKQHIWRNYVNNQLASRYHDFFGQFHLLVMLKAPDFACVREWRGLQEAKLAKKMQLQGNEPKSAKNGASNAPLKGLMDENALNEFMMHYERLTKQMLLEMPERADVVLALDKNHNISRVDYRQ